MCLAKAFLNSWDGEPVLQEIAYMRLHDSHVELEALLGEEKTISGRIVEVDFTASRVLLTEHRETEEPS